ncbi:hypothetical protein [Kitasatospora purpeofusca]|uniref:hypothetical protein n=1 Tax=Kitasatospora purpeofusca TaxID=67352 RepID=UPI0005606B4C|nr:hypothetical protein [Kitasatospora purpeofusca]
MTASSPGSLQSARFCIAFRCNSPCGYCNVWQDDKFIRIVRDHDQGSALLACHDASHGDPVPLDPAGDLAALAEPVDGFGRTTR